MARSGQAIRNLRRAPAFTGLVILTLALGIGATTAMFSVVDAVLLNPLPFPNADRFSEIWTVSGGSRRPGSTNAVLQALRRQPDVFAAVEAYQFGSADLTGHGDPLKVGAPKVTPGLLAILGTAPMLGRLFTEEDAILGAAALISERLWVSRFGSDPAIVGKEITIDDAPHRVVGVMPSRFRFPEGNIELWRPLNVAPTAKPVPLQVIAVRRPELTIDQVDARLQSLTPELRASANVRPTDSVATGLMLQQRFGRQSSSALYILFGAVSLVMLVACVNVMNLLLVRASTRSAEFALMSALGAGTIALVRTVLLESVLLAAAACVGGVALARGLLSLILRAAPPQLTFLTSATSELDARALTFAIGLTLVTCVMFGVLPAWRAVRADAIDALKQRAQGVAGSRDDWWQGALVTMQLALVLVLLAGSGLLLRSFGKLVQVDPGFRVDELAVVDVQMGTERYTAPGATLAFMQELERRVEAAGLSATISGGAPPTGGGFWFDITPDIDDGRTIELGSAHLPYSAVEPDYFNVMGIAIVEGRTFDSGDPQDAVIVNSVMAKRFFGDAPAVGRRFRPTPKDAWRTVVGIAADVKQLGPQESLANSLEFYERFPPTTRNRFYAFVVRTPSRQAAALQTVRQKLWEIDNKLPIIKAATMRDRIGEAIARPRFYVALSFAFAITGALLAAIGVYGVSAYWVSRRRRELAIRIAIGASSESIVSMVMRRSLRFAAAGAVAGLFIAVAGARALESMLFETGGRDPWTLAGVTALLGLLVVIGCLAPAIKAARVDPMSTLRSE